MATDDGTPMKSPVDGAPSGIGAMAARWASLQARERRLMAIAAAFVGLALLWMLALQPALKTLRSAPVQLAELDEQLQQMHVLAAEATELRGAARLSPAQAGEALKQAMTALGDKARLTMLGDRATVTLSEVPSTALRDWLANVRASAHTRPVEANLTRSPQGWSGNVVLQLGGGS